MRDLEEQALPQSDGQTRVMKLAPYARMRAVAVDTGATRPRIAMIDVDLGHDEFEGEAKFSFAPADAQLYRLAAWLEARTERN